MALAGPNDSSHERAVELSERWLGRIVTTDYVLAETGSLLSRPDDGPTFVNLIRNLRSDPLVRIVPASRAIFLAGFDLFAARLDKEWSMVDCTSFAIMKQLKLRDALSTDHHFVQAGFRALLADLDHELRRQQLHP